LKRKKRERGGGCEREGVEREWERDKVRERPKEIKNCPINNNNL
jgi:hypothetical protein